MAAATTTVAASGACGTPAGSHSRQCYIRGAQQPRQPQRQAALSAALSGLLLLLLAAQSPSGVASAQRRQVPGLRGGGLLARGTAGAGASGPGAHVEHDSDVSSALSQHKSDQRRRQVLVADATAAAASVTRGTLRSRLLRSLVHEVHDDEVVGAFLDEENPLDGGSDERGGGFIGESADEDDGTVIVQGASSGSS